MTDILKSRIAETSTSTGAGAFTLDGAVTAHQAFSAVCSVNDVVDYVIYAVDASSIPTGDWEEGAGTYSGANTLTRTTVKSSSNAGSAVSFAAGTKIVILSPNADRLAMLKRGGTTGQIQAKASSADFDAPWTSLGALNHAAAAKTTLVDADEITGQDSAASYGLIRATLANLWTYIKGKADAVYSPKGAATASGLTMGTGKLLGRGTSGAGAIEEVTLGANLTLSGTTLNATGGGSGSPQLNSTMYGGF